MKKVLRYSILNVLVIPIYIFSTSKYKEGQMMAIAIICLSAIFTTLIYWKSGNWNQEIWKYSDRLFVISLIVLILYYGRNDKYIICFVIMGILFYLMGSSDTFKESDSFLNHMLFRYFVGISLIIYVTDDPYTDIFIGVSTFFLLICVYYSAKGITNGSRKSIIF